MSSRQRELQEARRISDPYDLLTVEEQNEYDKIYAHFYNFNIKGNRNSLFIDDIGHVISFLQRSEKNFQNRCIVAGIYIAGPIIVINTKELKRLMSRCKSSINGGLLKMGYRSLGINQRSKTIVQTLMPNIATYKALTQWTVRVAESKNEICIYCQYGMKGFKKIQGLLENELESYTKAEVEVIQNDIPKETDEKIVENSYLIHSNDDDIRLPEKAINYFSIEIEEVSGNHEQHINEEDYNNRNYIQMEASCIESPISVAGNTYSSISDSYHNDWNFMNLYS